MKVMATRKWLNSAQLAAVLHQRSEADPALHRAAHGCVWGTSKSPTLLDALQVRTQTRKEFAVAVLCQLVRSYFPTLAVGLLDFKVDVVLARLEADCSD